MGEPGFAALIAIFLFGLLAAALAVFLVLLGRVINPTRPNPVKNMPYESGMDPIHGARRRFDVRFHLMAIAFLVLDVELLFLYPWAVLWMPSRSEASAPSVLREEPAFWEAFPQNDIVAAQSPEPESPSPHVPARQVRFREKISTFAFSGGLIFLLLLTIGFLYDWRKGVFSWR
jgi:NADH-quinone oxidoreductase subunit A